MDQKPKPYPAMEAYVEAALALLGLTAGAAQLETIKGYFDGLEQAARLVISARLDDELDAAPVFAA